MKSEHGENHTGTKPTTGLISTPTLRRCKFRRELSAGVRGRTFESPGGLLGCDRPGAARQGPKTRGAQAGPRRPRAGQRAVRMGCRVGPQGDPQRLWRGQTASEEPGAPTCLLPEPCLKRLRRTPQETGKGRWERESPVTRPPICPGPSPVTPGFGAQCTTLCACPPWGSESRVHTEGGELQGLCPKTLPAPKLHFLRSWGVRMRILSGGNNPSLRISFHDFSSLPPHPASHPKC